jgi:hypothetical protein
MGGRGDLLQRGRHFVRRWCCAPPPAPSELTAGGGGGSGEVMVTWDPLPATAGVAFYRVYRAKSDKTLYHLAVVLPSAVGQLAAGGWESSTPRTTGRGRRSTTAPVSGATS